MGPPESSQPERVEATRPLLARTAPRLVFLFVLALVVRVLAVGRTAVIFNDGPEFLRIAAEIADGAFLGALAHDYHPLYSIGIALGTSCGLAPETAGIALSVLAGCLAVLALYAFLVCAFDRTVAFVGACVLALHPYAIRFSADVQSEALYLALFLGSIALLYRALARVDARSAALSGLLGGFAYLTRPEGIGVPLVGLLLILLAWLRGRWTGGAARRVGASLALSAAVLALPYWFVVRFVSGEWQLSQKKSVLELLGLHEGPGGAGAWGFVGPVLLFLALLALFVRFGPALRPRLQEARLPASGLLALVCGATLVAGVVAPTMLLNLATETISTLRPELALLLAAGIYARRGAGPQGRTLFVCALLGLYVFVLSGLLVEYGYVSRRHVLPPVVLVFGYVAVGLVAVADRVASRWRRGRTTWVAGLLVALALIGLPKAFHDHRGEELAGRRAAEWLRAAGLPGGELASNKSKLGYYADRPWQTLYWQGDLRGLDDLYRNRVRWLILEATTLDADAQPVAALHATRELALEERYRVEARGHQAVVLEIVSKR